MAKESGLGDHLFVGGYDVTGDVGAVSTIRTGIKALECTGLDKSAVERFKGLADGDMEFTAFFNPATGATHEILSTLPTTDVGCMYQHGGTTGNAAACLVAKQIDYAPSRKEDGAFTFKTSMTANAWGLEWADLLAPKVLLGVPFPGTPIDYGAGVGTTAFGLQAYLQVFTGFIGTSATVAIQHSNDNGAGDPYADISGAVFTPVSALGTQRIQTARNTSIKRYVRVNVTGTFTALVFAVAAVKNLTSFTP